MTAYALERAGKCVSCGTSAEEWAEDPHAYAAIYVTCQGCMRREIMQSSDTPITKGTSVRLVPKAMAARLEAEAERKRAEGTLRPRRRRE